MALINYEAKRQAVVKGLSAYLGCPVIRANQTAPPPAYPFVAYTVTTVMGENNGTYEEYEDDTARKVFTQTWSISALSDNSVESVELATKAREWFDFVGTTFLNDNNVIVHSVGAVTNRDNILTIEYEYKNGFDVVFVLDDVVIKDLEQTGWIESVEINETEYNGQSYEDVIAELTNQLETANAEIEALTSELDNVTELSELLGNRLEGVSV